MLIQDISVHKSGSLPRIDAKWIIIGVTVLLVAWFVLIPLVFLLWQSFVTPYTRTTPSVFTFMNYVHAFSSARLGTLLSNSFIFASGTALFALALGTTLAWLNERTNTPFKSLFFALSLIPLIIPSILFTVSWILLASPQIGLINRMLRGIFGVEEAIFDIYSMGGMIWVDGLHYSPMAFLLMTAAFRAMDPSLEESAMMSGSSILQTAYRITLKLTWPAIVAAFLIIFIRAIESFEVPALLGVPVGLQVFTSSIYQAVHGYPSDVGLASAFAVILLGITSLGIYFQSRLSNQGSKFSTVTGKGFRPRQMDLGRWRHVGTAFFILYALIVVVLPFLTLLWSSLHRYNTPPSFAALSGITLDAYRQVLALPAMGTAVWNSIILAIASATAVMLLTSVISWIVIRTKLPGRWLLDNLSSLPLVFPGLVLGLAMMVFYLNFDIGIYGTLWILFIAYMTRFLPYGIRYTTTSMLQIHKELEESATMSGASWSRTFRAVILPLMKPGLLAGWIYIVIVSIRELSSSILLYSPGTEVVSIMIWELWQGGTYVQLCAFGVMLIGSLFILVLVAQALGSKVGVKG
ncbi:ABC transporter permease [Pseudochelatococcus sp. B33]